MRKRHVCREPRVTVSEAMGKFSFSELNFHFVSIDYNSFSLSLTAAGIILCVIMSITWFLLIADFGSNIIFLYLIPISHMREYFFYFIYYSLNFFFYRTHLLPESFSTHKFLCLFFFLASILFWFTKILFFSKKYLYVQKFNDRFIWIHFLINFIFCVISRKLWKMFFFLAMTREKEKKCHVDIFWLFALTFLWKNFLLNLLF